MGRRLRAQVRRRAGPHTIPLPFALVDLWVRHGGRGQAAYEAEAQSIGRLLKTPTSQNLVRVFFLRERLRGLAPRSTDIRHVHVVGAGVMGGDIAAWCALRGFNVTIHDRSMDLVEPALKRADVLFRRRLRAPGAADEARSRLISDAAGVADADLVIEAIVERLDAKQALFTDLERQMRPDAVLATNTSSIDLERLSEGIEHPGRFLGLHFFNPVARLPLVEVVRSDSTDDAYVTRAMSFVSRIGKLPLPCRSAPGFLVNRTLAPYLTEALFAYRDGYAMETIDSAAEEFGMPMGPVELADRVGRGCRRCSAGREPGRKTRVKSCRCFGAKVEGWRTGAQRAEPGFIRLREHHRPEISHAVSRRLTRTLQDRLILQLVRMPHWRRQAERVVEDTDLVDAGVIFGTGFAPFRGGPIHYARQRGIRNVIGRMESLAASFGPRFTPHPAWKKL